MASSEHYPPSLDQELVRQGYGNALILLDHLCLDQEGWVVTQLISAEDDNRRLYLQAYASVVRNLRSRLKGKANDIKKG